MTHAQDQARLDPVANEVRAGEGGLAQLRAGNRPTAIGKVARSQVGSPGGLTGHVEFPTEVEVMFAECYHALCARPHSEVA
jgi:hypothetical protein